ncbi:MAG: EamA family transporter [Clostridium sp.]
MENKTIDNKMLQKPWVVCSLAMLCCTLWGSAFPCIKIGYRLFHILPDAVGSQILFAGLRFTLAGILTVAMGSLASGRILLPVKTSIPKIFKLCMVQTVIQYLFFYMGLAHATGVKSAIITGTNSLMAILIASLIFRQEKLTIPKMTGCILGFIGVALANMGGSGSTDLTFHLNGEGFIFISAVSYAFSSVLIKRYSVNENPVMLSGWQFTAGGVILMTVGLLMGGNIGTFTASAAAMLFYLALLSAVAYTLWSLLLKYNSVSRVTIFGFMNPVVGVLLSALLLGEGGQAFSGKNILALLLVSAGIYVVNRFQNSGNVIHCKEPKVEN